MGDEALDELHESLKKRVAIIGVGNELRGDDAVGCYVAQRLMDIKGALVIDAGEMPENYAERLRHYEPDCVLFVDAVDMGVEAGSVVILSADDLPPSLAVSTHGMPLSLFANYLRREMGAEVLLIGIQVKGTELGEAMSEEVRLAADALAELIRSTLDEGKE